MLSRVYSIRVVFELKHSCKADQCFPTKCEIVTPHLLAWTVEPESTGKAVVTCVSFFGDFYVAVKED